MKVDRLELIVNEKIKPRIKEVVKVIQEGGNDKDCAFVLGISLKEWKEGVERDEYSRYMVESAKRALVMKLRGVVIEEALKNAEMAYKVLSKLDEEFSDKKRLEISGEIRNK